MVSDEVILQRDRVECLVRELTAMLKVESHFQFKIRFDQEKITVIPHASPVEITR